ncbi:hypothetical protein ADL22_30515 [Streptomyces sp. NRRL F-4489]|uniref:hypothetical protein n=1 Tax=Streptomyces sp. NRRL F-4489 TaxID=1609095 RepID=UPI00074A1113|nr:hypothetical protein [Streptomyces sp. NRRL F-4489]KUL34383.1 hypothetical protein ADL22_30515 [Streptomyces sp. NRRL F-4489]
METDTNTKRALRKKKAIAGVAVLAGAGLLAAGGYALSTSTGLATSGLFGTTTQNGPDPDSNADVSLLVNGHQHADLSNELTNAKMANDGEGAQTTVKLTAGGKTDIDTVGLKVNYAKTEANEGLAKQLVVDVDADGKRVASGLSAADIAKKTTLPISLSSVSGEKLLHDGTNALPVRLHVYLKDGTEKSWDEVKDQTIKSISFSFTGSGTPSADGK